MDTTKPGPDWKPVQLKGQFSNSLIHKKSLKLSKDWKHFKPADEETFILKSLQVVNYFGEKLQAQFVFDSSSWTFSISEAQSSLPLPSLS